MNHFTYLNKHINKLEIRSMCVGNYLFLCTFIQYTYNPKLKTVSNFVSFCSEPEITCGLSDIYALRGKQAELNVKMNTDSDGAWFKDGEQVNPMNSQASYILTICTFYNLEIYLTNSFRVHSKSKSKKSFSLHCQH